MKKKLFSVLLIVSLLTCLLVPVHADAYDLLMGDVDSTGTLTAGDARTILRAAVSLETLSSAKNTLADVDFDGMVSASDARMVLRASVGLEKIGAFQHTHTMQDISTTGSCTEMTIVAEQCSQCKTKNVISVTPAPGHDWNEYIRLGGMHSRDCKVCGALESGKCELIETVNRPATCTQDGLIEYACVCGLTEQTVTKGAHDYGAWTKTANGTFASTCTNCSDKKTATQTDILNWFNDNVNRLKTEDNPDRAVTVLRYTDTKNSSSDFSTSIKLILGLESTLREALDFEKRVYNAPGENRAVTDNNLPALTKPYVSDLTADDIKSLDINTNQTVNVLDLFPTTYSIVKTVDGEEVTTTYDLSDYKNTPAVTDAIKISIAIHDETATATGQLNGIKNVYTYQSNGRTVAGTDADPLVLSRFYGIALPDLCTQFPETESSDGMNMYIDCPGASSAGTADWYFDSETLEPIACAYKINIIMQQNVEIDSALINGSFNMETDIHYTYVFLFKDYYPCMAE